MMRFLSLALLCAMPCFVLHAEARKQREVTPVEVDEIGNLIVKVRLSSRKPDVPDRDFRFILDTGAGMNVIDVSVPTDYFWDESLDSGVSAKDVTGQSLVTRTVFLKRMELGGMVHDEQRALRMDLKTSLLGRMEDQPADGILGMNFLRGKCFTLDPQACAVRWWAPMDGHRLSIGYDTSDRPVLSVKVGGSEVWCQMDTGANGGFQMPGDPATVDGEPFFYSGYAGAVKEGRTVKMDRLEAGSKVWSKVPLDLVKAGDSGPQMGRSVLWVRPITFDFVGHAVTFSLDEAGNLPYRSAPDLIRLGWDRSISPAHLRVEVMNPTSRWAKLGLRSGDDLLAVGPLAGQELTIRGVQTFLAQGKAHVWRLRREGKEIRLEVPAGCP